MLSEEQQAELEELLESEKAPDGGLWNGPKIARWIEEKTGREHVHDQHVHDQRGWDYLVRLGFPAQTPRPQAVVRPRYQWLYIYAFVWLYIYAFVWLYIYAFVCPETGETEFWLAPSVNTETFGLLLQAFLRKRREAAAVMLVLDRAGWHVAGDIKAMDDIKAMEQPERLELKYLPSHSPELQPTARSFSRPSACGH